VREKTSQLQCVRQKLTRSDYETLTQTGSETVLLLEPPPTVGNCRHGAQAYYGIGTAVDRDLLALRYREPRKTLQTF
jgi:hypothetical protein